MFYLFSDSRPLHGEVDDGSGVHEAVAELVTEVAANSVHSPTFF